MKLVSDFDGVWTDPGDEARAQGVFMDCTLADWVSPDHCAEVSTWIAAARERVAAEPTRYGWAPGGRLSAFGDEDPFAPHSALLHLIHLQAADDARAAELKSAVEAHGFTLESFGAHAHAQGVQQVARERGPGILADAAEAGRAMLSRGIEVVVVSNSGTDKLAAWFEHAQVPARVHPERAPGALCLRGAARKFILDDARRDPLAMGPYAIECARPHYESILRDERPDAVVGDVFSLDLALPLALKRRERAFRGLRLFWLMRDYTPAWLRAAVQRAAGDEVEYLTGGLPEVAERLAPSTGQAGS